MGIYHKFGVVAASTGGRLVGTLVMYGLMARSFGPRRFGEFGYWYSVGLILSALSDYGFGQQILTTLSGFDKEKTIRDATAIVQAKLFLVTVLFAAGGFVAVITSPTEDFSWIFLTLAACALATIFDFFGWMLKAREAYGEETKRTLILALIGNSLAGVIAMLTKDIFFACATLSLVRLLLSISQYRIAARMIGFRWKSVVHGRFAHIATTLRHGSSFALDSATVQGFSNIDVLLVKYMLDAHSVGLYLAGSRVVQAALAGIPVLASIFVPQMSRIAVRNREKNIPKELYILSVLAALGAVTCFSFGADFLPCLIFGDGFSELNSLMSTFGLAVAVRYLAVIPGTALTAMRRQRDRAQVHFFGAFSFLVFSLIIYYKTLPAKISLIIFSEAFALLGFFQLAGFWLTLFLIHKAETAE